MRATFHQLKVFHKVATLCSYTAAGNELGMTQPAVSIQLKQLEENLEIHLVEKLGKKFFLTRPGEELFRFCTDLFERFSDIDMTLSAMKGELEGEFRIAAVTSAMYFTPHLLGAFHKYFPKVSFRLEIVNREQIIERIKDNKDDLVIMGQVPEEMPLSCHPVVDVPVVVIANPSHPLAASTQVSMQELVQHDFIVREQGSGTRKAVESVFLAEGLRIKPSMVLGGSETIKQAVMADLGLSAVSRHSVTLELATGSLVEIPVKGFPLFVGWHLVHHKNKQLSPIARAFIDFVLDPEQNIEQLCDRFYKSHFVENKA